MGRKQKKIEKKKLSSFCSLVESILFLHSFIKGTRKFLKKFLKIVYNACFDFFSVFFIYENVVVVVVGFKADCLTGNPGLWLGYPPCVSF